MSCIAQQLERLHVDTSARPPASSIEAGQEGDGYYREENVRHMTKEHEADYLQGHLARVNDPDTITGQKVLKYECSVIHKTQD
ncbi:hypothetical protein M426DRAFT_323137 [Hypoxylon sp. CI-4A]|nr:hypothetical protein M426DRAFT_323137 [Hypoxylon sp. CI-4A]